MALGVACIACFGFASSAAADLGGVQTVSVMANGKIATFDQASSGTDAFIDDVDAPGGAQEMAYGTGGFLYTLDGDGKVTQSSDADFPGIFKPVSTQSLDPDAQEFAPQLDNTWFFTSVAGASGRFGTAQSPFLNNGDSNAKVVDFNGYLMRSVVGFQRNGQDMAAVAANTTCGGVSCGMPVVFDTTGKSHASAQFLMDAEYIASDGNRLYLEGMGTGGRLVIGIYDLAADGTPVGKATFPVAGGGGPMDFDSQGDLWVAGQDRSLYEYSVSATGAQVINTINAKPNVDSAPTALQIEPPLTISSRPSLTARVGQNVSFRVKADHGKKPFTFSVARGPLPAGLHLSAKGVLSGKPTRAGRSRAILKVVDSGRARKKQSATAPLSFNIRPRG
jgi:Putative Ig domain